MNCFHHSFVQVRIWVLSDIRLPRWPTKWPPPINVCCRGHSNLVIFYRMSFKLHVWIASIKLLFKFEYKFSLTSDNQYGRQNDSHLSICFCGQSTLIIFKLITSKFHMAYFYQTHGLSDNQDGRQNGRHLSVYTCGHSSLVIYHPISSKFHIWTTFIKLLFISEYEF